MSLKKIFFLSNIFAEKFLFKNACFKNEKDIDSSCKKHCTPEMRNIVVSPSIDIVVFEEAFLGKVCTCLVIAIYTSMPWKLMLK